MEFAILGPLEVTHDGEPVPLPGRTVPRLAAALLLDAGHVVTLPRLIDTIWDDDPPTAPRRDIQNAVSVLRKRLFDPGRELVETVGEGIPDPGAGRAAGRPAVRPRRTPRPPPGQGR